ncbi:hypothetical protein [Nocardiopsis coralli]|uniref:hypothetical protein n=1 Tax=Nocardiopsis coralli TaxID=2772213 RepID=UPI001865C7B2
MAPGLLEDPRTRGQEAEKDRHGHRHRQQALADHDHRPRDHPLQRSRQVGPLGEAAHQRVDLHRRALAGELVGGGEDRAEQAQQRQQCHQPEQHRDPDPQGAVGPAQEQPAEHQPGQPVRAQDVADEQQRRVHQTEGHEPQVAPPQEGGGLARARPGRLLAPHELHHPVTEQEGEHGVAAHVHGHHREELRGAVERPLGGRVRRPHAGGRDRPQVPDGVGQGDEQKHEPAGQVGREGPLPGSGGSAYRGLPVHGDTSDLSRGLTTIQLLGAAERQPGHP